MSLSKTTLHWKFIIIEIKSNQVFSVFIQLYAVNVDRHTSTLQSVDRHSLLKTNRMSISLTCRWTKNYCTRHVDTTSRLIARHVNRYVVGSVNAPLKSVFSCWHVACEAAGQAVYSQLHLHQSNIQKLDQNYCDSSSYERTTRSIEQHSILRWSVVHCLSNETKTNVFRWKLSEQ